MKYLDDLMFCESWLIHKVKRFLIAHPEDGFKFHQLDNLSESDCKLAECIRNPNNLLLFGSKMNVHPDDNVLEMRPDAFEHLCQPVGLGFSRHFTNSKGNLFRNEIIFVYESGVVSYSCLNRCFHEKMVHEPALWRGAEHFYYYLDDVDEINELVSLLLKSDEFSLFDEEKLNHFKADPKAWRFKPLHEYVESLKGQYNA